MRFQFVLKRIIIIGFLNKNKHTMKRIKVIICVLLLSYSAMAQVVEVKLQNTYQGKDSLNIKLTIRNTSEKPIILIGAVRHLEFEDYIPAIGCGDKQEYLKRTNIIERKGDIKDTITLTIPVTEVRFQKDFKGEKRDVFNLISHLEKSYYDIRKGNKIPVPPKNKNYFAEPSIDTNLCNLLFTNRRFIEEKNYFFKEYLIALNPKESRSFNIDLSYLLLQKSTYKLKFNYEFCNHKDYKLFKDKIEFFKKQGFLVFKGQVTSNIIYISSK